MTTTGPDTRRLILMRHATSPLGGGDADHDRQLSSDGRADATRVGAHLLETGIVPERALVSDAKRAQETWEAVVAGLGSEPPASLEEELYLASPDSLYRAIEALPSEVGTGMIVAHNPGLEDAISWLCGVGVPLAPASLALLETDASDWRLAVDRPGRFALARQLAARELR